jgi:hypothetical protein
MESRSYDTRFPRDLQVVYNEGLHEFENKVFLRVYQPSEDDLNDLQVDLNNVAMDVDEF